MKLTVYSPEYAVYEGEVELVELPGAKGRFVVLENHDALISTLVKGLIRYVEGGTEKVIEIDKGYAEVKNNVVTACVTLAAAPQQKQS